MTNQSSNTTTLNRRKMFAASAALAVAVVSSVALAKASGVAVPFVDREFAAKCKRFQELKAALNNLYEANDTKLNGLPCPELPGTLLEPLEIPGSGKKTPDENGWSSSELERLATQGKWEVFVREDKKNGSMTVRSGFRAVPQTTKKRATELLPVRVAYDAAVKRWWSKINRIENSTGGPIHKMDNALLEVMKHPATHAGELLQKVLLAKEADLFADGSCSGRRDKVTLKCLFRDIQNLAMQA